jgi:hypothetical protein
MDRETAAERVAEYLGIPADLIMPYDVDLDAAITALQAAYVPLNWDEERVRREQP